MEPAVQEAISTTDYFRFAVDENLAVTVQVSPVAAAVVAILIIVIVAARCIIFERHLPDFEIDEAEFGLGDQKVILKPNNVDRAVAYKIWVELSTRKIGLPIDWDNDVISEIYDSWYEFFAITRELIKDVPVQKFERESTQKVINLSIEVLNIALRPHLTRWQARFRRWYAWQLEKDKEAALNPQDIQRELPDYGELVADMKVINNRLIVYRAKMRALVTAPVKASPRVRSSPSEPL